MSEETNEPTPLAPRLKRWNLTIITHVWPVNDLIEHVILGNGRACGAEVTEGKLKDGSKCWEIVYNALDGRE